jgi:hypothetical protein
VGDFRSDANVLPSCIQRRYRPLKRRMENSTESGTDGEGPAANAYGKVTFADDKSLKTCWDGIAFVDLCCMSSAGSDDRKEQIVARRVVSSFRLIWCGNYNGRLWCDSPYCFSRQEQRPLHGLDLPAPENVNVNTSGRKRSCLSLPSATANFVTRVSLSIWSNSRCSVPSKICSRD